MSAATTILYSAAGSEPEALPTDQVCKETDQGCRALDSHFAEADAEADLMQVNMLQTVLTVGGRRSLEDLRASGDAVAAQAAQPATPAHGRGPAAHATVHAQGDIVEDAPRASALRSGASRRPGTAALTIGASSEPTAFGDADLAKAENEDTEATPALFQTDLELSSTNSSGTDVSLLAVSAKEPQMNASLLSIGTADIKKCTVSGLQMEFLGDDCAVGGTPLALHAQLDFMRLMGFFPPRDPILPGGVRAVPVQAKPNGQGIALITSDRPDLNYLFKTRLGHEELIITLYGFFYIVSMTLMYYWMMNPPPHKGMEIHQARRVKTDVDVEEETYRQGILGWFAVSWASPWVAKWGHSVDASRTKIKPSELPQMGRRENQSLESALKFERLWEEEIAEVGKEKASVFRVMIRMWTIRTICWAMFIMMCQVMVVQIYSVVLIEKSMNYFYWLQDHIRQHGEYPDISRTLLLSVLAFLALPFSNIVFTSVQSSVACKLDQKTLGGLSLALFRKSQRLPAFASDADATASPKNDEAEGQQQQNQGDLMNLINGDINTNLNGAYLMFGFSVTSFLSMLALTALLWVRLHWATLFAIGCAIPVILFSIFLMGGLAGSFAVLQGYVDKRVAALREVLYGIRIVKGYAWEGAMLDKVSELRREEMKGLRTYFHYLGVFLGIFFGFPRVLILSGLWGYATFYGQHDVATIFTCMQILSSLRWCCDTFIKAFANAILIQPSIHRIETYLKLPEAPLLLPDKTPDWVQRWPEARESDALSDVDTPKNMNLEVRGTFKWNEDGVDALQDVRLEVPRGQLVGIVGAVGSGKSTFLQALLGELYPDTSKPARVSRPDIIAYCSQVPHIAEGTLKENILFGQPFEAERYAEAVQAASLKGDLAVLPGGDEVPIGSRGITLSGGQKARVAMARAAYHKTSELVIIDDPFAAVDAPTAKVILEDLLLGPLMSSRTRVVTLQPDADRIKHFDHVIVMEKGRIKEQGIPDDVVKTAAYQKLLSTNSEVFTNQEQVDKSPAMAVTKKKVEQPGANKLREEEVEGRPSWDMMMQVCRLGGWSNLASASALFTLTIYLYLLCDLALARWTNAMVFDKDVNGEPYIFGYFFWMVSALVCWGVCWFFGEKFSLGISGTIHDMVAKKILNAPTDRFFDKHPVGRILNRLSTDLLVVDLYFYVKGTGGCTAVYQALVPIIYVHTIMPWYLALAAIPFYWMMSVFCQRFWNTTVPLRYCMSNARSDVSSLISDVVGNKVVIRAFQDQERITMEMGDAMDAQIKAGLIGDRVLRRWLVNRIIFMWSFYTTTMYMVGLLTADNIGAGTLGICLTNLLLVESNIDMYLDTATGAQFEFIALARIYEYLSVPQEKAMKKPGDARFTNFTVKVPRKDLGRLSLTESGKTVEVSRNGVPVLRDSLDGTTLMVADTAGSKSSMPRLSDLCPSCEELGNAEGWHRIVAANDAVRDAGAMARELCGVVGENMDAKKLSTDVVLEVQSGWLLEGAEVEIDNLKAGYADVPRDVLKGLSLSFGKKQKVAIAGTTGCGKSSLLLVLLRILEPRAGRILFNGVDIGTLGLATLRSAVGLVPQDPVLFSGTLRHNLDPFCTFTDGRIWQALRCVQLENLIEEWPDKLEHKISDEGGNLSFGQRQLVCLARMILRQPGLLLLDEATSAIEPHTQQLVQQTIKCAFPSSTLVAVAHRLETVLDFDHVVVMDHGDVAEQGPVKELTERKDGIFRKMLAAKGSW